MSRLPAQRLAASTGVPTPSLWLTGVADVRTFVRRAPSHRHHAL